MRSFGPSQGHDSEILKRDVMSRPDICHVSALPCSETGWLEAQRKLFVPGLYLEMWKSCIKAIELHLELSLTLFVRVEGECLLKPSDCLDSSHLGRSRLFNNCSREAQLRWIRARKFLPQFGCFLLD